MRLNRIARTVSRYGRNLVLASVVALTAIVSSCGGGGGSEGSPRTEPETGSALNGTLLYAFAGKAARLDLATGTEVSTNLEAHSAEQLGFGGGVVTDVVAVTHVTANPTEYTVNLHRLAGSPIEGNGTLPTISATGLAVSGPVQPSPDGMLFAIHTRESPGLGEPYADHVYLVDKAANVRLHVAGYRDAVWFANDGIVAAGQDGLFILRVGMAEVSRIGSVGLGRPGTEPAQPSLSPDRHSIAFVQDGAVWRIDLDGTDLSQLSQRGLAQSWPTWSPDGSRLAVLRRSCPVLGTGEPEPDIVTISAESVGQDIAAAARVMKSRTVPARSCGPVYWIP